MDAGPTQCWRSADLDLACELHGPPDGWPVVLSHGFPYDARAFDRVLPPLLAHGARVLVPHLRGFGRTRLRASAPGGRSGQQAAIGRDLAELLALADLRGVVLAGFDWGNRAGCVVAALWPERVCALVAGGGYAIQHLASAGQPQPAEVEARLWYQFYFGTERGRRALEQDRRAFCAQLWRQWSPRWDFTPAEFAASADAFDNPDFVDVVIHSYRHRLGLAPGHPAYADDEARLARLPAIALPTVVLEGDADGVAGPPAGPGIRFTGPCEHRVLAGAGHNLPQERPEAFAQAVLDARALARAQTGARS